MSLVVVTTAVVVFGVGSALGLSGVGQNQAIAGEPTGVQVTVTCLGGNGRVDVNIVNLYNRRETVYRVELSNLSPRNVTIAPGDWGRVSITGRPDDDLRLLVFDGAQLVYDTVHTITCDEPEPVIESAEVRVANACRDGNGYLLIQFANPTAEPAPYVITFDSVPNRSTTAAPYGAAVRAVTGRYDGDFEMVVRRAGVEIHRETLTVACDTAPDPTPTPAAPTPTPTPELTVVPTPGIVDLDFTVKETAGVGAAGFPVQVVVPFADGQIDSLASLRIETANGEAVPAQFDVLNRWETTSGSARHVTAQFLADVDAFTGPGTGISAFRVATGVNPEPADAVAVEQRATSVVIQNSQLSVEVHTDEFGVELPTGDLNAEFRDVNNAVLPTFDRDDISVEIEEAGPIRAVIVASAPTRTQPDGSILHGWSMRLYAYAGQSHIKVDIQLQNAALDSVKSGPLYFESFTVSVPSAANATPQERRAVLTDTNLVDPAPGIVGSGAASLAIRQFYETWPNSVEVSADGTLTAGLFPAWSENQVHPTGNVFDDSTIGASGSGLYWLEDMQAVVKEFVIDFAPATDAERNDFTRLIDHPPVAVLPVDVYRSAGASLDLGGTIPNSIEHLDTEQRRTPDYPLSARSFWNAELGSVFFLGWDEFLAQPNRKRQPAQTGGWPDPVSDFIASGDPTDYFLAADRARGELNVMPQWLPGYNFAADQGRLELTENPYNGDSWRQFLGHNESPRRFEYLEGTAQDAKPRDDAHGWFYNVESSYYLTADPWVRDWYEFIAEFRKVRLTQGDPFPDMSGRAVGNAVNHAIQAYRVTGDQQLLDLTGQYIATYVMPELNAVDAYSNGNDQSAAWQVGFLARSVIDYLEELDGADPAASDPVAFDFVKRTVEWNVAIGNFDTWRPADATSPGVSWGGGLLMADPQAWYFAESGWTPAFEHLMDFVDGGINGGEAPYGNVTVWDGSFEGRLVQALIEDEANG